MTSVAETLATMTQFADLFSEDGERQMAAIAQLLLGNMDEGVYAYHARIGTDREVVEHNLNALKDQFRAELQLVINQMTREASAKAEAAAKNAFLLQHAVSDHGTTAEIADKLGVSKKQVRRMKQDGTLEQALTEIS